MSWQHASAMAHTIDDVLSEYVATADVLQVGFPRRDPDRLRIALDHTHRLIWVRATKQSRVARLGQLLGFARATSDGVLNATIW